MKTTFADTFFDVALGSQDSVLAYAQDLKEDFLSWIQEYDMDYAQDQWDSEGEFEQYILAQCQEFICKWRGNIAEKLLVE